MRRKEREVSDFDEIIKILERCTVLHLAMISDGKPYSVPVNFGYIVREENGIKKLNIYIHGAGEGKKVSALKENPSVCFSTQAFASAESLVEDKSIPCEWTCYYESVIGSGTATFMEKSKEKSEGLDSIMFHNGYKLPAGIKQIAYQAMSFAHTSVIKIAVDEVTGKRHIKKELI